MKPIPGINALVHKLALVRGPFNFRRKCAHNTEKIGHSIYINGLRVSENVRSYLSLAGKTKGKEWDWVESSGFFPDFSYIFCIFVLPESSVIYIVILAWKWLFI